MLETLNDEITSKRQEYLNRSPRLEAYHIHYCYASDVIDKDGSMNGITYGGISFSGDDLIEYLESCIKNISPEVLLLHTGFLFMENQEAFIKAFRHLKKKHRNIGTNYQKRIGLLVDDNAFNLTGQAKMVGELIFERILGLRA